MRAPGCRRTSRSGGAGGAIPCGLTVTDHKYIVAERKKNHAIQRRKRRSDRQAERRDAAHRGLGEGFPAGAGHQAPLFHGAGLGADGRPRGLPGSGGDRRGRPLGGGRHHGQAPDCLRHQRAHPGRGEFPRRDGVLQGREAFPAGVFPGVRRDAEPGEPLPEDRQPGVEGCHRRQRAPA